MKLFYLFKKELLELFRQKELLPLIFVAPVIQVILLGYVVTTDIKNLPVNIVDLSGSRTTERIINRVTESNLFNVENISQSPTDNLGILQRGDVKAIIVFRNKIGSQSNDYPEIQILMDGVNSNTSSIAAGYFSGIVRQYILNDMAENGIQMPLQSKTLIRFNPDLKSINYMGPGLVALLLTILTTFFASITIVREKEQQTMDTLLVSQLTPLEIFIGKAVPMGLVGFVDMLIGLTVVIFWFKIPVRGNLLWLFFSAIVFLLAILSYALLISTISKTSQQALFFGWFSMLVFILLSGLFTPVENIPIGIRWIADINPVRYLMEIIREIFLKGNGPTYFWEKLVIMGGIAVVVITISLSSFRRMVVK